MFKNKRGIQIDKEFVIEAVLISIVVVSIFVYLASFADNTYFEKLVMVRKLALLSSTIQSSPGNVFYRFNSDVDKEYIYDFSNNNVAIIERGYSKTAYPLFYNKFLLSRFEPINYKTSFYLSNFNNQFIISSEPKIGTKTYKQAEYGTIHPQCPEIEPNINLIMVVLDAAGGDHITKDGKEIISGKKNAIGTQVEQYITYDIVNELSNYLSAYLIVTKTRNERETAKEFYYEKRLDKITPDTSLVLSIHTAQNEQSDVNEIRAYAVNEQSKLLACFILNDIQKNFPDVAITLLEIPEQILLINPNKLAVKLEIGNINYDNNPLYSNMPLLAESINNAVKEYIIKCRT